MCLEESVPLPQKNLNFLAIAPVLIKLPNKGQHLVGLASISFITKLDRQTRNFRPKNLLCRTSCIYGRLKPAFSDLEPCILSLGYCLPLRHGLKAFKEMIYTSLVKYSEKRYHIKRIIVKLINFESMCVKEEKKGNIIVLKF